MRIPRGRRPGARGDRPRPSEPGGVRPGGRARAARRSICCRVGRTTSTKSVRRSSYWDERCWSAGGWMRRKSASGRPTRLRSRWRRSATGRRRGSHWGTSRRVGVTTARPHVSTGTPPRRSRKSASREEVADEAETAICCSSTSPSRCVARSAAGAGTPGPTGTRKTPGYTRARMRPAAALTVLSCLLFSAGCGGSATTSRRRPSPEQGRRSRSSGGSRATTSPSFPAPRTTSPATSVSRSSSSTRRSQSSRFRPRGSGSPTRSIAAVPRDRGEARADRRPRRRRGGRDAHLRRDPPAAAAGQVLAARRARGRQREGAGARERRRGEDDAPPDVGDPAIASGHADAGVDWW